LKRDRDHKAVETSAGQRIVAITNNVIQFEELDYPGPALVELPAYPRAGRGDAIAKLIESDLRRPDGRAVSA